jgi:hypothetical protein
MFFSTGLNDTPATVTTPANPRTENTGTSRRQTMHSRRYMGMPAYKAFPKPSSAKGPKMIPDTAQRGK